MKMIATFALMVIAPLAHAEGFYIGGHAGANITQDSDIEDSGVPGVQAEAEFDTGTRFGAVVGYDLYQNQGLPVRVEAEFSRRDNDIDTFNFSGPGGSADCEDLGLSCSGEVDSNALLANGWYDFNRHGRFRPYVGGGVGVANVDVDVKVNGMSDSDDDTVFAYQFGVGIGYAMTERVDVSVDYRFFGTEDPNILGSDVEYQNHSVGASVRFRF